MDDTKGISRCNSIYAYVLGNFLGNNTFINKMNDAYDNSICGFRKLYAK